MHCKDSCGLNIIPLVSIEAKLGNSWFIYLHNQSTSLLPPYTTSTFDFRFFDKLISWKPLIVTVTEDVIALTGGVISEKHPVLNHNRVHSRKWMRITSYEGFYHLSSTTIFDLLLLPHPGVNLIS